MIALIVCIVGIILYLATDNKPSEAGRIMFFAGLLALSILYGGKSLL